jgi:mutator protein MutT
MEYTKTVGVVVLHEDEVLVVRHTEGATHHTGVVGFPAGRIQEGETSRQAAVRELREESGLIANEQELIPLPRIFKAELETKRGREHFEWTVFLCTAYTGELESSDETEPFWVRLAETETLPTLVNFRDALSDALQLRQALITE